MREYNYKNAVDCQDGQHRRRLERIWKPGAPVLCIIGLNPSYADAQADDRTLTKMVHIADRHGFGAVTVVNLFSKRSPSFKQDLRGKSNDEINDVVNDLTLKNAIDEYDTFWLAWGHDGKYLKRDEEILSWLVLHPNRKKLLCIGTCKNGAPIHPGHQSNDSMLRPFSPTVGDFYEAFKNSKRRDYRSEVNKSMENSKFSILISLNKYDEFQRAWNLDPYSSSILEQQKLNPDVGSALVAWTALQSAFDQFKFPYQNTEVKYVPTSGSFLRTGDFIYDDQIYLLKTSFKYCTVMVTTRYDMDNINVVLGAHVVLAPPDSGYYCTVYYFGAKHMSAINFNREKDDYRFATLKPSDFRGNSFFKDGIISLPI